MKKPGLPKKRMGSTPAAGERILEVASDLFYRRSIHSVGVEEIVQAAGVAKISLYRSYQSKDDLIAAYLAKRNREYWQLIEEVLGAHEGKPRVQLRTLFGFILNRTTEAGYRGCTFINYAAEYPEISHPGRRVMNDNKSKMRQRLVTICKALEVERPRQLADALFLLVEGAYASSQTLGGSDGPAKATLYAAEAIIDAHI
jgi:AcrR family transcriptional regulator